MWWFDLQQRCLEFFVFCLTVGQPFQEVFTLIGFKATYSTVKQLPVQLYLITSYTVLLLFCFVLFCFVLLLFCFVLLCFVLFCFVLFCFVLFFSFCN